MNARRELAGYIGCVDWGTHTIPSEKRACALCACEIALSKGNVEPARNLTTLCVPCCISRMCAENAPALGMVAGKLYADPAHAKRAAVAERDRN